MEKMEVISESSDSISFNNSYANAVNKDEEIRIPRPPNAFMIFGKEYRKILAEKFKDFSNKQISKILGEEWKIMDKPTKDHYHRLADETHRLHLIKYPGYYYSPLEARQRKAERKRKSKMSRNTRKLKGLSQTNYPVIETFGGNGSVVFQNPVHPMMRPLFGTPIPPRIRFGGQPMIRYGLSHPFGGFVRFGSFGGFSHSRPTIHYNMPINTEHSYAALPTPDQPVQQTVNFEADFETQTTEVVVKTEVDNEDNSMTSSAQTADIDLLYTYLPPMLNPNIEVTPVVANEDRSPEEDLKVEFEDSKSEIEMTKMSNALVDNGMDLSESVKQLIEEDKKEAKVVVKTIDQ